MKLLALDPGALCGYAWTDTGVLDPSQVDVWDFGMNMRSGPTDAEQRALHIGAALAAIAPDGVVFVALGAFAEFGGTHACAITDAIKDWCSARDVSVVRLFRPAVKRHATGLGHATAAHVVDAARSKLGYSGRDPKEALALWTLDAHLEGAG